MVRISTKSYCNTHAERPTQALSKLTWRVKKKPVNVKKASPTLPIEIHRERNVIDLLVRIYSNRMEYLSEESKISLKRQQTKGNDYMHYLPSGNLLRQIKKVRKRNRKLPITPQVG
jgi:hypothetical protein